ncbi:Serine/threonine-protein kinase dyrk2 [Thalictrum thalictroides]|uniref:Serine/threonine-protein kinase dyrk2 n=1 Tax=Thalictrum thalictroides TaxID=46969 RepID=A0A7J6X8G6_THATH|nr:Serine/threonine-protein kinase dyrk2 [Thalictrum thalictroides]
MDDDESEKMDVMKKVYAEIILNTAKEAAARIMVSERKAKYYQQNVVSTKDEALNMLLRVKQVMDYKIAESEMISLRQRLKIEELEAQLHEAEDIVTDLRDQLKEVQNELENMKKAAIKPLEQQSLKSSHENSSHANEQNSFKAVYLPLWSGFKDASFYQRKLCDKCCLASENALTTTESSCKVPVENNAGNPDLASIIMTNKEHELYRNGCTQRIRAFERNSVDGKLCAPLQTDNGSIIKEDGTAELTCSVASLRKDNMGLAEKKPTGLEESLGKDSSSGKGQNARLRRFSLRKTKSIYRKTIAVPCGNQVVRNFDKGQDVNFRRISLRKSKSKYRKTLVPCVNQVVKTCSVSTRSKAFPCRGNSLAESGEDLPRIEEEEVQKNSESHLHSVSSLDKTKRDEVTKDVNVQNAVVEDNLLIDKSKLSRQGQTIAGGSGLTNCSQIYDVVGVPTDSDSKHVETCDTNIDTKTETVDDRLLKYTFRRKRKKGSLSCPDESERQEKRVIKKKSGEKQISSSEPHKSSLTMESSRDSRRLVQVARQLISLSKERR